MSSNRGQALVETALILPIILIVLLAALDPFLFVMNAAVAKSWTFLAAREASIHRAGGGITCQMRVSAVPTDTMVNVYNVTTDVTPCPNDPAWITPSGTQVLAKMEFDYDAKFWFGQTWSADLETRNIFQ